MMYDIYFEFFGESICIHTGYEPEDFADGFWMHEDDNGCHLSETKEESVWMIPPSRIIAIKKIEEGD